MSGYSVSITTTTHLVITNHMDQLVYDTQDGNKKCCGKGCLASNEGNIKILNLGAIIQGQWKVLH